MSEKQARIRAIFAKGNPGPNVIWGTSGGPIHLHLSLFLFIVGGLIYLFNINRFVFYYVAWWVGYMALSYAGATVAVFFEAHNLLHTPLSPLALRIYLDISYVMFQVCSYLPSPALHGIRDNTRRHYRNLSNRYSNGLLNGKRKEAKEIASKPSSEIDALILERILPTLDDDHALETFFDAIPSFCQSKLTEMPLSSPVKQKLRQALDGFLDRTFSSSLISESARVSRLITCLNAAHAALGRDRVSGILDNIFYGHWDEALQSVEIGHALTLWGHSRDYDLHIRRIVACIVARVRERDDRWIKLVKETFGVPDHVLLGYLSYGDSVLLFILIHISRETKRTNSWASGILSPISKFDILNTLPELQHEFCAMWNEYVQDASYEGQNSIPTQILREIRELYVALHQDTSTALSASTDSSDHILTLPSSYPMCCIPSHHPPSIPHVSVSRQAKGKTIDPSPSVPTSLSEIGGRIPRVPVSIQAMEKTVDHSSSDPTSLGEIRDSPRTLAATPPASPDLVVPPLEALLQAVTLPHPPGGTTEQDIVAPHAEPVISENLSANDAKMSRLREKYAEAALQRLDRLTQDEARITAAQTLEVVHGLSQITKKVMDGEQIRVRGLVNPGSTMGFVNAVLQLLVHSPLFWNLFWKLGNSKGQRGEGGSETASGATPLVDATVRFLDEFMIKDEPPLTQREKQQAEREDEEGKKQDNATDSFEPTYMYDAMKKKRQLKHLLVRSCATLRPAVSDPCWPNVYRMANSRTRKSFSASTSMHLTKSYSHYSLLSGALRRLRLYPE
jgi:hypothetical protein